MNPEAIANEVLEVVETTGAPADRILKRTLRRHPELNNEQRKRIATLVHGVRCHRSRLDFLMKALERTPSELFATYDEDQRDPIEVDWPDDPVERLAIERSLPRWIAQRFVDRFGDHADFVAERLNKPGPLAVRANLLLNDAASLSTRLASEGIVAHPGQLAPHALRLERPADIRGSDAWRAGCFEVQDEASQLVAAAVEARPGETVIDLCAGAGGKTLAMAADMRDEGRLYACDVDTDRLHDLSVRLKRVPLRSVHPIDLNIETPPAGVDRVLVDAPCSATGTWRRGPDRKWRITETEVTAFVRLQTELLERATNLVRPGGRVVYATCSLLAAENDEVVRAFAGPRGLDVRTQWILPHEHDTDGFFIATFGPLAKVPRPPR